MPYLAAGQPAMATTRTMATAILIIMVSVVYQRSQRSLYATDIPIISLDARSEGFLCNIELRAEDMHGRVRGIKAIGKWAGLSLSAKLQYVSTAVTVSETIRPTEYIVSRNSGSVCLNGRSKFTEGRYMHFVSYVAYDTTRHDTRPDTKSSQPQCILAACQKCDLPAYTQGWATDIQNSVLELFLKTIMHQWLQPCYLLLK